jgi:cysteine desulfurase
VNFQRIYLDHAATTPLRPEVTEAMHEALVNSNYNPSSLHDEGRRARALLEGARERIAAVLGASRTEITFTSGGTEANNIAVFGVARAGPKSARFVSTAIEHHAILGPLERLRDEGFEVSLLPVGSDGRVEPAAFATALDVPTHLASVMYANNEIGTVQPIAELAAIARRRGVLFHTDAVQAPAWLPIGVGALGIDLLSISAHKFGGPRGVGVLYVRRGVPLAPVLLGGGQEFGRRPGTENVAGAVGMARALELATAERQDRSREIAALRDRLEAAIRSVVPGAAVNGARASRLANNLNVSFPGGDSAAMLIALDLAGVAVSAGSACTSGSLEPSHVLEAIGLDQPSRRAAIRFSLGPRTTPAEIERVIAVLPSIAANLGAPCAIARGDG